MATVNKILLPRRAKKSVMQSSGKSSIVLEKGELFIECPDEGIGKGHSIIKIGDGNTAYSELPYAIGDTSNDHITFTESSETQIDSIIAKFIPGTKLNTLVAFIKKSIILFKNKNDAYDLKISDLTDGNTIEKIKVVTRLPEDAGDNPTTLYLIKAQ